MGASAVEYRPELDSIPRTGHQGEGGEWYRINGTVEYSPYTPIGRLKLPPLVCSGSIVSKGGLGFLFTGIGTRHDYQSVSQRLSPFRQEGEFTKLVNDGRRSTS